MKISIGESEIESGVLPVTIKEATQGVAFLTPEEDILTVAAKGNAFEVGYFIKGEAIDHVGFKDGKILGKADHKLAGNTEVTADELVAIKRAVEVLRNNLNIDQKTAAAFVCEQFHRPSAARGDDVKAYPADGAACCETPKTRGPNVEGFMVCPIHCSKCKHPRRLEDHLGFCSECTNSNGPCAYKVRLRFGELSANESNPHP